MGGPTVSYITVSAVAVVCSLVASFATSISANFFLMKMKITINVMMIVAINVTMNVITQAIATTAPLDCEFEYSVLVAESLPKVRMVNYLWLHTN